MRFGIFAKTFERPTVEAVFEAVDRKGFGCVQFNLSCAGLPTLPDNIPPTVGGRIRQAAEDYGIEIAALSGTYNMIHPDPQVRAKGLRRLRVLAAACSSLGTGVITLCTGSRDPVDQWQWHPENASPQAWSALLQEMEAALGIAEEEQVTLAFEPERANVVSGAEQGHALLKAMQSAHLKVVIDPANLIVPGDEQEMERVMDEAFDLLGEHIIIAHAKDRRADDRFCAAGEGVLNYDHYLQLLETYAFGGPLIVHGLAEAQVDTVLGFLNSKLSKR